MPKKAMPKRPSQKREGASASPPARTYWKGHLRLSLVSAAVSVYPATASAGRLALHQIHESTGRRIRYEKVAPGVGAVDSSDIVKGFEISKDTYVILQPEEKEDCQGR